MTDVGPGDLIDEREIVAGTDVEVNLDDYEAVYRIDGGGKTYVGRCRLKNGRTINDRLREHTRISRGLQGAPLVREAVQVFGPEAFTIETLEVCHKDDRAAREIFWINELNTLHPNGYNLMGGDTETGRYHMHEDSKKKISGSRSGFHKKEWAENPESRATLHAVYTNKDEGYRGFHKGVPKSFMSSSFTLEEKKMFAM